MAQSVIHPGLKDPKTAIGDDAVVFGELLAWGARVAIGMQAPPYEHWKNKV